MPASHNGSAPVSNTGPFRHPGSIPGVGVGYIYFYKGIIYNLFMKREIFKEDIIIRDGKDFIQLGRTGRLFYQRERIVSENKDTQKIFQAQYYPPTTAQEVTDYLNTQEHELIIQEFRDNLNKGNIPVF